MYLIVSKSNEVKIKLILFQALLLCKNTDKPSETYKKFKKNKYK